MKYQEGLKETKDFLKTTPEPQIREICNQAGLTERETEMIVQKFRKGKSRLHSSYDLGMSESRYSIKLTLILNILKKVLVQLGFIRNIFEINSKQHFAKLMAWLIPKGELTMFYFDRLKIYLLLAEVSNKAGIPLVQLLNLKG